MQNDNLQNLLMRNQFFIEGFKCSPLMQLLKQSKIHLPETRKKLLAAIQTLSDYFQKTALLRYVFSDAPDYTRLAKEHLKEEFGHNDILSEDRGNQPPTWDPILEATAAWFSWKMLTLNDAEKTVLMHLVLETSGNIFFHEAHKILGKYNETSYFAIHSEVDELHEKMGNKLLEDCSDREFIRLFEIQQKGWDILNVTCAKIAELAGQGFAKIKNKESNLFLLEG